MAGCTGTFCITLSQLNWFPESDNNATAPSSTSSFISYLSEFGHETYQLGTHHGELSC